MFASSGFIRSGRAITHFRPATHAAVETMQYYSRLTLSERWLEVLFLLKANSRSLRSESFAAIFREIDEYRELFKRYCARDLENAKVFEIGYGRRPDY